MNKCKNYKVPCPFALVTWNELPCFGTQEQCDIWTKRWQTEEPETWRKACEERQEELRMLERHCIEGRTL